MNFLRGTKSPLLPSPAVNPENRKAVIHCEACGTDCRVPADRGTIRVTCPGCGQKGLWTPPAPEPQAWPARSGSADGYPEEIRLAHSCKAREGLAILTFRRSGPQGKGSYQLHKTEMPPRGGGQDAFRQVRDQACAPDTFPHDLIDWSEFTCPHCRAPATQTICCDGCSTVACVSSVSKRNGRPYFTCLCGNEGTLTLVDVVDLTPARAGRMSGSVAPGEPPAQTAALRLGYQRHAPTRLPGRP